MSPSSTSRKAPLAFLTQTTLSVDDTAAVVDALKSRFPSIRAPRSEDICYATSNRQAAVKAIAAECDRMLVIGAPNSSNSLRLAEVAERLGVPARLIERAADIDWDWLENPKTVGITAGASAPEVLVREVVDALRTHFSVREEEADHSPERMTFCRPASSSPDRNPPRRDVHRRRMPRQPGPGGWGALLRMGEGRELSAASR
jgi:4-hydroxy-3-methylbut-2-enyl diphosphate reductase